MEDLNL